MGKSKQSQTITSISDVVSGLIQEIKKKGKPSQEKIQETWCVLAGQEAATHSSPKALSKGTLWVEVENSSWMYTLNIHRQAILQGFIELVGAAHIRDLKFKIADR